MMSDQPWISPWREPAYPLETDRLRLRPFTEDDFEALHAYQSSPDVTRFLYWEARGPQEVRAALEKKIASRAIRSEGDVLALAVELKDTSQMVGDFILQLTSEQHRTAELGYVIHPDRQGHGYATEAGRVLLRIAFEHLNLHRVVAGLDARNVASARVLEKLGMRQEAHFVENEFVKGEWQSAIEYAILAREWLEPKPGGIRSQGPAMSS
jgi:RimJ/RimL family protein N-acetyltransferase